jgi:hypothetical protein
VTCDFALIQMFTDVLLQSALESAKRNAQEQQARGFGSGCVVAAADRAAAVQSVLRQLDQRGAGAVRAHVPVQCVRW